MLTRKYYDLFTLQFLIHILTMPTYRAQNSNAIRDRLLYYKKKPSE